MFLTDNQYIYHKYTMLFVFMQYYTDANEAESWMREKMPLVLSEDYGKDQPTAKVDLNLFDFL